MSDNLKKSWGVFQKRKIRVSKDDERIVIATSTWVPFFGTYHNCTSRLINKDETDIFKNKNDN